MTRALEAHLRLLAVLPVRTHLAEFSDRSRGANFFPRKLQSANPCERTLRNRKKRDARIAAQWL